jgi:ketosteroid isomerase-like protein
MPATPDPATVALLFNDCITARDLDALCALMTDDHTFIDTTGQTTAGREACRAAWRGFFAAFPDLAGPALWTATSAAIASPNGGSTTTPPTTEAFWD